MRESEWRQLLEPLLVALQLPAALTGADGEIVFAWGDPAPAEEHLVGGHSLLGMRLRLPAGTPRAERLAVKHVVEAQLRHRATVEDMARALAVAWRNANFMSALATLLQASVDMHQACQTLVHHLQRVQGAQAVALFLTQAEELRLFAGTAEAELEGWDLASTAATAAGDVRVEGLIDGCRLYVPLGEEANMGGLLGLRGRPGLDHAENLQFLANVAAQISQALRLRQMFKLQLEAAEVRQTMALATQIQRGLMPQGPVKYPGVAVAGRCRMADAVGGDGYDLIPHEGGLDVLVADVSGHGVAAGLLMSSFMSKVRIQDLGLMSPFEVAVRANAHLCREVGASGHYVTALIARVLPGARELVYTTMGHYGPLLLRRGEVSVLPATSGLAAGLNGAGYYDERRLALEPGDTLVFFTDGLVEARSERGEFFGLERLCQVTAAARTDSPEGLIGELFEATAAFAGGMPAADDQTAVVVMIEHGDEA